MDEELRLVFVRSWFYLYVASELFPSIDSLLNSSTIVLLAKCPLATGYIV